MVDHFLLTLMKEENLENTELASYGIEELARLTGLTRRTIRYYVQIGLLQAPFGKKRAAYYGAEHLERLLKIRRLTANHVPLEEIAASLKEDFESLDQCSVAGPRLGEVNVCSHVNLGAGLTLVIDPNLTHMKVDAIRELASGIVTLVKEIENRQKKEGETN